MKRAPSSVAESVSSPFLALQMANLLSRYRVLPTAILKTRRSPGDLKE